MTLASQIISPLLIAITYHTVSGFVLLSSPRGTSNPRTEICSPVFSAVANSESSTTIGKRKYKVKRLDQVTHRDKTTGRNESLVQPTIKKGPSPPTKNNRNSKNGRRRGVLSDKDKQFQWLHWVYNQWKDTAPGDLTDQNVVNHMMIAVSRWSKRRSATAALRAEELLERLIEEAVAGNPHMRTNEKISNSEETMSAPRLKLSVALFNAAMDAYGKIGDPSGVQRILRRMEGLRTSGVDDFSCLQPDEFSMSTLATAWAKSQSQEAAQKAEAIIKYMDLNGLIPNTITYNSVLHAIAVGNECDRALKAEDMVRRMIRRHEENGEDCQPDVYSYQSLIQAWSRTAMPGSPQEAERILRFMDNEASLGTKNSKRLSPNAYCFTTVIHSWARSSERNRARHAHQLLSVMIRKYNDAEKEYSVNNTKKNKSRSQMLKPNVKTLTAVLNACAWPAESSERADSFAIAQLVMTELSSGTYGKPNFLSYAAYLAVCGTTLDAGPERDAEAERTFRDCINAGEVGKIVLEKLYIAASPRLLHDLLGDHLDGSGQITIPSFWNRSIKGERAKGNALNTKVDDEVVSKIPKSFQERFSEVQNLSPTVVGDGDDEILWSKVEFSRGDKERLL